MAIQKSVCSMTGYFEELFGNGKYGKFVSNGCKHFISIEHGQQIPVNLEIRGIFEVKHETIVEKDKNGDPQPAGILKVSRFVGKESDLKK